jgi:hypothetical protein
MPTSIVYGLNATFDKTGAMTIAFKHFTLIFSLKGSTIQLFKNELLFEELNFIKLIFSLKDLELLLRELEETNILTATNLNDSILGKYGKTN